MRFRFFRQLCRDKSSPEPWLEINENEYHREINALRYVAEGKMFSPYRFAAVEVNYWHPESFLKKEKP